MADSSDRSAPTKTVPRRARPALTPWFPCEVTPVRRGVYEILGSKYDSPNFRHWVGCGWSGTYTDPGKSAQMDHVPMYLHGHDMTGWRGLASDPKEQP